jgi:hypothetical protein
MLTKQSAYQNTCFMLPPFFVRNKYVPHTNNPRRLQDQQTPGACGPHSLRTLALDPTLSHLNPVHTISLCSIYILIISSLLHLSLPNTLFLLGFAIKVLIAFILSYRQSAVAEKWVSGTPVLSWRIYMDFLLIVFNFVYIYFCHCFVIFSDHWTVRFLSRVSRQVTDPLNNPHNLETDESLMLSKVGLQTVRYSHVKSTLFDWKAIKLHLIYNFFLKKLLIKLYVYLASYYG